ncbi:prepilin-type N-terminal cleavage/methylation domain-containing protein [Pelagicoccus mobilis]|uniref:Type II secretion system protein n=1 Tax=Pelagicoccus mobilis TaxID=415221 RepID=A0A934VPC8_9BACT|nr:type II secretion system protein [Pelagicoccus mobilis]MBK1875404.1 type II secretion system protein [Pelagicoccus mobilis]
MLKPSDTKKGFTLIELLTVIAILAILGAIIFPTVGQFRTLAKKTSDSNDLRNIVQASQMFAAQNGERLVGADQVLGTNGVTTGTADLVDIASILAYGGELTDPANWVSANDASRGNGSGALFTEDDTDPANIVYAAGSGYAPEDLSYSYVTGLRTSDSATTPVVFTRKSSLTDATWAATDPYGTDGGHIAFLGGNVSWFDTIDSKLINVSDGTSTNSLADAVPGGQSSILLPVAAGQ